MPGEEKKKILIVEDDESMRETLWVILKQEYQVLTAVNGEQALEILEADRDIRLVMLDILLPGIDGIEVLRRIKEKRFRAGVIMVSVVRDVETVVEAMKLGALTYIDKRFDFRGLLDLVGESVRNAEGEGG